MEAFQNERARTDLGSGIGTQRKAAADAGMSKDQNKRARGAQGRTGGQAP